MLLTVQNDLHFLRTSSSWCQPCRLVIRVPEAKAKATSRWIFKFQVKDFLCFFVNKAPLLTVSSINVILSTFAACFFSRSTQMLATCQVEGCTSSHMQEILLTLDGLLVLPRTQRKLNSTNLQPCRSTTVKSFVFSSVTISYIPMVQTLMACKFFREDSAQGHVSAGIGETVILQVSHVCFGVKTGRLKLAIGASCGFNTKKNIMLGTIVSFQWLNQFSWNIYFNLILENLKGRWFNLWLVGQFFCNCWIIGTCLI